MSSMSDGLTSAQEKTKRDGRQGWGWGVPLAVLEDVLLQLQQSLTVEEESAGTGTRAAQRKGPA